MEAKFLELEDEAAIQRPLPKKRKREKKTVPQQQRTDAFAKCAAELQIYVFVKVNRGSRAQIGQLETLNV